MDKKNKKPVINVGRRIFACVIILIIASLIGTVALFLISLTGSLNQKSVYTDDMQHRFLIYGKYQADVAEDIDALDNNRMIKSARLTSSVLKRKKAADSEYTLGVQLYGNGAVFRCDGKNVKFPEGIPGDLYTGQIQPDKEYDCFAVSYFSEDENDPDNDRYNHYYIAYSRIDSGYYYMEWMTVDDYMKASVGNKVDWTSMLNDLARTYEADFMFVMRPDNGKPAMVLSGTNEFADYNDLDELELNWELIEGSLKYKFALANTKEGLYYVQSKGFNDIIKTGSGEADGDDTKETSSDSAVDDELMVFVMLIPIRTLIMNYKGLLLTFLLTMLLLCIVLIVWLVSIYNLMIKKGFSDREAREYNPSSVKQKVFAYVFLAVVIMGASCAFSHTLNDLFRESVYTYDALGNITHSINTGRTANEAIWNSMKDQYVHYAERIAALLDENPELRTEEWLQEASDIINSDYIMLYDTRGDQLLTNSRYKNMSLGKNRKSATYDFRRLLNGVRNISHEKLTDEVTGLTRDMYGISLKYVGRNKNAYGALIIAVDPETRLSTNILDIDHVLETHAMKRYTSFAADPDSGKVKYSSERGLKGADLKDTGFNMENLKGAFVGFFDLSQSQMFGRSAENGGLIYFYSIERDKMFVGAAGFAIMCMVMFLVVMLLIMFVLLFGYNFRTYTYYLEEFDRSPSDGADGACADSPADSPKVAGNRIRMSNRFRKALGLEGSPLHMAMITMMLLAAVYLIFIAIMTMSRTGNFEEANASVIRYIMYGKWQRGVNIFSITAVFFVLCILSLIEVALYLVRVTLKNVLDARGMTIASLITSILQTVALISAACIALGYFGVDTKAILASVGIVSMAFTFGAKDFVADMFAGFDLLTNNTYQMGDEVIIDGYSGTVQEVTLRITKLLGSGGNVKTIRNSSIGSVINLSVRNSWYPMEVNISASSDLKKVEQLLKDNLPVIKKAHPDMIISGPEYRGVESMGGGKLTILILTECEQANYYKVEKIVNEAVYSLLAENDIAIM